MHKRWMGLVMLGLMVALLGGCVPRAMRGNPDYTFVFIRTGPATGLSTEQQEEAFRGHFSNMARLAGERKLLIAGPFGEPRADASHRGLWVFNTPSAAKALELGATDPTVELGIFVLDAHPLATGAPIRSLPRLEEEDEARRLADPDVPDEWQGRRYVLATHPWSKKMARRVNGRSGVLIAARLYGHGADGRDEVLAWLDAETPDAARAMLPDADAWTLHGWYGSKMLSRMRE
ncbi:MAG: hypothetical protein KJZ65_09680 [Phycisphaerales bacterium]|nr:hypothetical protein [Phycisphaerales bacterium]